MNRYVLTSFLTVFALTIYGCTPLPEASTVSKYKQIKLQSAQHWNVIADHLSDRIMNQPELTKKPIYLRKGIYQTKFREIFSRQLTSSLVAKKANILISPSNNSLNFIINVDSIRHPEDRDKKKPSLTAIYANLWLVAETKGWGLVPTVAAIDHTNSKASQTNTEIVITTQIIDNSKIIFSETNVYYTTDLSIDQYDESKGIRITDKEIIGAL